MKAWQRQIREQHAIEEAADPLLPQKRILAASFDNATVREIDYEIAKTIILKYEWLKSMGVTDYCFGLYFGEHLAGAVCFGRTAGTNTAASVCGEEYAHVVKVLNRGACVYWADSNPQHKSAASFLITRACRLMAEKYHYHVFIAYSDPDAGEIGTVYQACGWQYAGTTKSGSSGFVWTGKPIAQSKKWGSFKDGQIHDERNIQNACRDRYRGRLKCSRAEMRARMIREGFIFIKAQPKGRYVGIYGDRLTVKTLRAALRWEPLPYPKREVALKEAA